MQRKNVLIRRKDIAKLRRDRRELPPRNREYCPRITPGQINPSPDTTLHTSSPPLNGGGNQPEETIKERVQWFKQWDAEREAKVNLYTPEE